MRRPHVAIDLYTGAGLRLEDARRVAVDAEQAGYEGLWTLEAHTEPFLPLALAAEHTTRLRLGTAVAVALVRNPMVVAHMAHELNRYAGGRLVLGLGSQVGAHVVKRFGEPFDHPADRMREYVAALRAIWACWNENAPLDFRGRFYRHTLMTPAFDPGPSGHGPPRIHLAAVGPRMCEVAARTADGLIAHPLSSPRILREVIGPRISSTAAADFELSCPVMVITGDDESSLDAARRAVRRQIAFYASTPAYRDVLGHYGRDDLAARLRAMSRAGEWDAMADLIDDDLLAEFSVEAPSEALPAEIHRRYDGVLDRVMVYRPYAT
ncbi:TIGR03617 family F420-dependent LLM class oxidoreductase [Streptomyces muensis]|uniref:TIGR03617 family F420-dependent LLM class oxidoreductase n=1 Tax=Streptomyces muensis TaxID=1077944 RepID=A0A9X1PRR6_STRM4|nr:TIGR03617 family F420-dependent LLM class oxidoreductase [Streptomyces muensis]MCF1592307.1 TIGR03617 family F420-dependent LLM class oxidoreductase [Streptomyces muensis]